MKSNNKIEYFLLGVALLCSANSVHALALGKARGAVLLGQPLSLSFVLQYEQDEVFSDWCFEAEVFYGETRQEGSRVSTSPIPGEAGTPKAVRVIAAAPVDEPVVTVYLRSTCGLKIARKYVLLSDLVSDVATPNASESLNRPLISSSEGQSRLGATDIAKPPKEKFDKPLVAASRISKDTNPVIRKPSVASTTNPNAGPRLKISILDLLDVKNPDLRLSQNIAIPQVEDSQKREEAKALWRSLNASTDDSARDEKQHQAVLADLKNLREISGKNQSDLQELSSRLVQAEAQRFANPLTYALSGLSIFLLFIVVALLARLRKGSNTTTPWWRVKSKVDESDEDDEVVLQDSKTQHLSSSEPLKGTQSKFASDTAQTASLPRGTQQNTNSDIDIDIDLDLDLGVAEPSGPASMKPKVDGKAALSGVSGTGNSGYPRDFSHSLNASLHAINTQEMLDVRQQADFFMTLGQHEEAISLLENSIRESEASNPLVYIDLLKVLHTLSRKPAFDHYRNEFNAIFTGWAPQYSVFGQPGNSLDAYPQICAEISQVWGTEAASEFLEQCMVRSPEDAPEHYFDLDAFRDLLMLHAIAARIGANASSDSSFLPFSAVRSSPSSSLGLAQAPVPVESEPGSSATIEREPSGSTTPSPKVSQSKVDDNLIDFDASEL